MVGKFTMVFASGGGEWRLGRSMRELSGGDGNVRHFDRGLGYTGVCICSCTLKIGAHSCM